MLIQIFGQTDIEAAYFTQSLKRQRISTAHSKYVALEHFPEQPARVTRY